MWSFRLGSGEEHDMVSVVAIRSPVDGRLFLAYPHDSGALSQSFDKLQLLDDGGSDLVSVVCFVFMFCIRADIDHAISIINLSNNANGSLIRLLT